MAALGCGSAGRERSRAQRAEPALHPLEQSRSGSRPVAEMTETVTKQRPSLRAIATSGSTASAGGSEDQIGSLPPSGANASPVDQTGPAPAGSPLGSSATRSWVTRAQPSPRSRKRSAPRLTTSAAVPSAGEGEASVGLLPAEPAIGGQAGARRRSRPGPRSRSTSTVAETSLPGVRAGQRPLQLGEQRSGVEGDAHPRQTGCAFAHPRIRTRAWRGRSRSRPCGPSRSGRAGGSCARRPRSCRRCRSPRWSASGARHRRSWRGRCRRTA